MPLTHRKSRPLSRDPQTFRDDRLFIIAHIKPFLAALQMARQHGVHVALSNPCFELWLLLHHVSETGVAEHLSFAL